MDKKQSGQVLLIVVLIMIVALTVGLSLVSRSIINLRTSSEEVSSRKALSAAEAGIEKIIQNPTDNASIGGPLTGDLSTSFSTKVTEVKGTEFLLNGGNTILQDEGADIWLSDYSPDPSKIYQNPWSGDLTLHWGESSENCQASALEIQVVSGTKSSPKLTRYAFDSCLPRSSTNHFTFASSSVRTVLGRTFYYGATISISSGLIARINPLYLNSIIGITSTQALPSQGFIVNSTGESGTTQRKVTVFRGYGQLNIQNFSHGLFAP